MYDQDHGKGAHIDNLETRDLREILTGDLVLPLNLGFTYLEIWNSIGI